MVAKIRKISVTNNNFVTKNLFYTQLFTIYEVFIQNQGSKFGFYQQTCYLCTSRLSFCPMEQKYKRIDRRSLAALLLVITRIIKADSRIDADEVSQLMHLEDRYGFDRSIMNESSRLTLAEAINQLRMLDESLRLDIMQSLTELASTDRILERHEAMLLLTLKYCLIDSADNCEVISSRISHRGGDLGTYLLYFEGEHCERVHQQIREQWELQKLLLQQCGLSLFYTEHIVERLIEQDPTLIKTMLGYLAPSLNDGQIEALYTRMEHMDTATFGREILVRGMELIELRCASPSFLINLGTTDFLRIGITQDPLSHIRKFLEDYSHLASPDMTPIRAMEDDLREGHFRYYSYYRDLFNLLVSTEPQESRIVVWPNKSEFQFPDAGRSLRLNQQEASLYCLILAYTYKYKQQGLPLSYTADQRKIEALYRTIYCRKKFIDEDEVIFPENLAPIRAKIERKMREQLEGLDNIEDFIPRNYDRQGFYRIAAPISMVKVRPDLRQPEVGFDEFEW